MPRSIPARLILAVNALLFGAVGLLLVLAVLLGGAMRAHAAEPWMGWWATSATTAMRAHAAEPDAADLAGIGAMLLPYVPYAAAALLVALAWLTRRCGVYLAQRTHSTRVTQLFDTLGSVAAGIALELIQHPPAPAATLVTVKQALVAQGVAYARQHLPDTIKAIGVSDDTLATRLSNEVAGQLLAAGARGLLAQTLKPAPVPGLDATGVAQTALAPASAA